MNYQETTQVSNSLFDKYLAVLKPSEVLVLLVIIRQTIGWYNPKTKQRKYRDWISSKQFQKKTGLSNKAVSKAIHTLINKKLIEATNRKKDMLDTPQKRKGNPCTFYRCLLYEKQTYEQKTLDPMYKVHITKLTDTKLKKEKNGKNGIRRLGDTERYREIQKQLKNNKK